MSPAALQPPIGGKAQARARGGSCSGEYCGELVDAG